MKNASVFSPFFLLLVTLIGCQQNHDSGSLSEQEYLLSGQVEGFEDSTWLYINIDNRVADSVMILDGSFELKGEIEEPKSVFLMTQPPHAYTTFWLEPGEIALSGHKDDFRNAIVDGPITNQRDHEMKAALKPLRSRMDSLNNLLIQESRGAIEMDEEEKKQVVADYRAASEAYTKANQDFIKKHPDSYVTLKVLDVYKTTWGKKTAEELFAAFPEDLKASAYGQNIQEYLDLAKSVAIGDEYTDFSMSNPKGEELTLSDIKDKYVLLEFWASWCAPCRKENPNLVKTYNQYKDKGFEILGVSLDIDKQYWINAIEDDGLTWPQVSDLKGDQNKAALMYGVSGIPDNFLIGPDGKIVDRKLRGDRLKEKLEEVFSMVD